MEQDEQIGNPHTSSPTQHSASQDQPQSYSLVPPRLVRSSARVRAAKGKDKDKETPSETSRKQTRTTHIPEDTQVELNSSDKGKQKDTTEPTRASKRLRRSGPAVTASGIVINEPTTDIKGKKRAVSETNTDDEQSTSSKKSRTTNSGQPQPAATSALPYSLRPRKSTTAISTTPTSSKPGTMARKTKQPSLAKAKVLAAKGKPDVAGPSSFALSDDDIEMAEPTMDSTNDALPLGESHPPEPLCPRGDGHEGSGNEDDDDDDDGDEHMGDSENSDGPGARTGRPDDGPNLPGTGLGGLDEGTAAALFGADYRALGSYMLTLSSRLKTILENIKPKADPTTRLLSLQELSELLSISTEDTLSGYFQIDAFVKELVKIMGGTGRTEDDDDEGDDGNEDGDQHDDDAALAAALAMSAGGIMPGDDNVEAQVLACRCLANLMEALPGCAHTVVYHGAVPVLCSKLIEIQYIDLAEQTLSTLEKISEEYPSAIVREGGLSALLNYLDFFSTNVQRTALQAASNCCRNASVDNFSQIRQVFPIIRNVLGYSDQRLVEYACLCVIRTVESFYRSSPDLLDSILDHETMKAVNMLLMPAGGSSLVSSNTYAALLRVLATAAKASPKMALALLDADIASTLYQILTGVLPPIDEGSHNLPNSGDASGPSRRLTDMAVMQNLAHRPKDQVDEALSLISELMPPLPKDGVFDHRTYTEKSLAKMMRARAKAERAASRTSANGPFASSAAATPSYSNAADESVIEVGSSIGLEDVEVPVQGAQPTLSLDSSPAVQPDPPTLTGDAPTGTVDSGPTEPPPPSRIDVLRSKPDLIQRFMQLMIPILLDVYAASVALTVRTKTLTALLKAVSFMDAEELTKVLKNVPMASFIGSIVSSRDNSTLVIGALQLVELLLTKLPSQYRASFRREGVLHEIDALASKELIASKTLKPVETSSPEIPVSNPSTSVPNPLPPQFIPPDSFLVTGGFNPDVGSLPMLPSIATPPSTKRSSSAPSDPQDAMVLRGRVIHLRFLSGSAGSQDQGDELFVAMQNLGQRLAQPHAGEAEIKATLNDIAILFTNSATSASISSFELMQSGLVDGLLAFATERGRKLDIAARQRLLLETFAIHKNDNTAIASTQSPFAIFVKRLQESLSRLEPFEVITVSSNEESKRGAASMLARQLRLRLVAAEGTTVPRNCTNITVSIHAIATFQALHDYLRPRVAGVSPSSGSSRLSGVLAAFAAASGLSLGSHPRAESSTGSVNVGPTLHPPRPPLSTSTPMRPVQTSTNTGLVLGSSAPSGLKLTDTRRRSLRLSKKANPSNTDSTDTPPDNNGSSSAAPATIASTTDAPLPSDMFDENGDDFIEEDFDPDVYDEDLEPLPAAEKTVNLAIADDGGKVEAQTPDGTRVATPNPSTSTPTATKASYASALKAKPTDWHLEFSMDDHTLPLDMTVYGAVHQQQIRRAAATPLPSSVWSGVYTIKFKKVPGPAPSEGGNDTTSPDRAPSPTTTSVPDDSPHSKILRLLRVLQSINDEIGDMVALDRSLQALPESAFVNNKLTAKLSRQLEEPMIVASSCLPDWAIDLPQHYPFLFPFTTRFSFLQSTSFGYARLILKWQSQQTRVGESSRRDDAFAYLGRLQRQKVRISRKFLLESAFKVLELYGSSSSVLEVEYFDEVGTGLGPTLEFYSLVSREFARRDIKMWHDPDTSYPGSYVSHPRGLFPAPFSRSDIAEDAVPSAGKKRSDLFRVLGQFVAKALLDSRIIDISLNRLFLKLILNQDVPRTLASLKLVDPALANSLSKVQAYSSLKKDIEANVTLSPLAKKSALASLSIDGVKLEDLGLDFTLPGYDIELKEGGKDVPVDSNNVDEYLREVLDTLLGRGIQVQARAFREGFSKVFPVTDLRIFSPEELSRVFGNADEDWGVETLSESIKADHGFNMDSHAIRDLIDVMASYDTLTRRDYLQFITGSPKLPIGGFRGLNPPLTVVRKPHEPPLSADDYLPSVMTCVNYLKLPQYSSKVVLREKLAMAMKEGTGSFHLS